MTPNDRNATLARHGLYSYESAGEIVTLAEDAAAALEAAEAKVQAAVDAERETLINLIDNHYLQEPTHVGTHSTITTWCDLAIIDQIRARSGQPGALDTARAEGRVAGLREAFNAASGVMFDGMPASPQQIRKEVVTAIESLIAAAPEEGKPNDGA